jgi:cytochrome P450
MLPVLKDRFALEEAAKKDPSKSRKDIMHFLMNATDPETGDKFMPVDLVSEAAQLVAAGTDTTSVVLSAQQFFLTRNTTALEKVQKEVRAAFNHHEDIRMGQSLAALPYLQAVINESLRLGPAASDILYRKVLQGGTEIDGQVIPEGTIVGVSLYQIHRYEKYFPRPHDFLPERWILGSKGLGFEVTEQTLNTAKQALIPFSTGPRNCVGKGVAMTELLEVTAKMVWLLDMRRPDGELGKVGEGGHTNERGRENRNEYQIRSFFLANKDGPYVQFKLRDGVAL